MNSKIVDIKGGAIATVVVGDSKYDGVDAVLLDGKTLAQITTPQLIYLRSVVLPNTTDHQLVTGEWIFRAGRHAGNDEIPEVEA